MVFALEFSDNVDPTALATFILAAITLATVIVGGIALRRTRSEIDLSRREVEEAHRPVLIPVLDDHQQMHLHDAPTVYRAKPFYLENNRVVLPIKNIGSGPALNITVFVGPLDDEGKPPGGASEPKWHTTSVLGLGTSEMMPVTVYIPGLTNLPSFGLALTYVDVAGKAWRTTADYVNPADGVYLAMSIEAMQTPDKPKRWRRKKG